MNRRNRKLRSLGLALTCAGGCVFQLGGRELGEITTSSTVDGREVIINLIRGAIITPIDQFITNSINDAFSEDD